MERKLIYKGKAKSIYTDEGDKVIIEFRDDLTAGDGAKKATMAEKGSLNAVISAKFFEYLRDKGVRSHYIGFVEPNKHVAVRVEIIPLEVICRNIATGSLVKRFPFKEGVEFDPAIVEFGYKDDDYHDPMLNDEVAIALGAATKEELDEMRRLTHMINGYLTEFLIERDIILVDFKLEFGKDADGNILLADEISPDTCRFWDAETREVMDKDRFRRDMGDVLEYYREVKRRICGS
ncbi:MAG: phosphoribosylaminoimidazolesuccinocarboxamide synthase [Candidatus Hydrothermarchaeales archaeon]